MVVPGDELRERAKTATREIEAGGAHLIVTSEMVLGELLSSASRKGAKVREAATRAIREAKRKPSFSVYPQTSELFEKALFKYEQASDKQWSLTDCASFVLMENNGINEALAHDQHFRQAGFRTLL